MKKITKKAFRATAWMTANLAVIWGSAFLAVLVVNWNDRPPSEAAEWFSDMYENRPDVADADNGFVYTGLG